MVKNCDLSLENAALGLRPRAVFLRPRSQFFTIRTSQPANNINIYIYILCIILFVFQRIISAPLVSHFILITPLFLFIKFHAPLGSVYNFAFDVNLFFPMSVSYNSSTFGKFWSLGIFVFIFPSYKLVYFCKVVFLFLRNCVSLHVRIKRVNEKDPE